MATNNEVLFLASSFLGANGFLDFACNMLAALDVTDAGNIEMFRTTFTAGLYPEF